MITYLQTAEQTSISLWVHTMYANKYSLTKMRELICIIMNKLHL